MSLSLETYINNCDFANQLPEVDTLLGKAQPRVTFWGGRVLEVSPDYVGTVALYKVISKTLQAASSRNIADDLTTDERIAGMDIITKLRSFIQLSNQQIAHCNFFTRLLCYIREFPFGYLIYLINDYNFRSYSATKYKDTLDPDLKRDTNGIYPFSDGECTSPYRILVLESKIRSLST